MCTPRVEVIERRLKLRDICGWTMPSKSKSTANDTQLFSRASFPGFHWYLEKVIWTLLLTKIYTYIQWKWGRSSTSKKRVVIYFNSPQCQNMWIPIMPSHGWTLYNARRSPLWTQSRDSHLHWVKADLKWTEAKWKTVLRSEKLQYDTLLGNTENPSIF